MFSTFLCYVECRCIEHAAWSMIMPLFVHFLCHADYEYTANHCFFVDIFETFCEKTHLQSFMVFCRSLLKGLINVIYFIRFVFLMMVNIKFVVI